MNIEVMEMAYISIRENFITDAAESIKNRIQTNAGKLANGFRDATDVAKNFVGGIAERIGNAQNAVSDFASNIIGSKNVKQPNQQLPNSTVS
jgi:phage-related protein